MDNEKSLSEDDESLQSSRRSRCSPKVRVKVHKKTSKIGTPKKT